MCAKSQCLPLLESFLLRRKVGDDRMQQLNVHDYYELGKSNEEIENAAKAEGPILLKSIVWSLFVARWRYNTILNAPCALLPASQRAAHAVTDAIGAVVPQDVEKVFAIDANTALTPYIVSTITDAIKNFETILKTTCRKCRLLLSLKSAYFVPKISYSVLLFKLMRVCADYYSLWH
jgi:hypothetical protein